MAAVGQPALVASAGAPRVVYTCHDVSDTCCPESCQRVIDDISLAICESDIDHTCPEEGNVEWAISRDYISSIFCVNPAEMVVKVDFAFSSEWTFQYFYSVGGLFGSNCLLSSVHLGTVNVNEKCFLDDTQADPVHGATGYFYNGIAVTAIGALNVTATGLIIRLSDSSAGSCILDTTGLSALTVIAGNLDASGPKSGEAGDLDTTGTSATGTSATGTTATGTSATGIFFSTGADPEMCSRAEEFLGLPLLFTVLLLWWFQ